jgi:arabinofuranosyltransferase
MKNISRRNTLLYCLLIVILSSILCIDRNTAYKIDDVFISLRYVMNIINGSGAVFNQGEKIEAISNPTWVWLISGISFLGNIKDPYLLFFVCKITSALLFIISSILFFRLLKLVLDNEVHAFFLSLIFSLNANIASYAMTGMENSLIYLLFIILLYFSQLYFIHKKTIWILFSGIFLGLLSISRPEGIIYIISYFGSLIIINFFKEYNLNKKHFLSALIISLLIYISSVFWRWTYYGEIIPLTVYAKDDFSLTTIKEGMRYFSGFLIYLPGFFIPFLVLAGKMTFKELSINRKIMLVIATVFFLIHSAFVIYAGGDWMPGGRLMLFAIPCFAIFFSIITLELIPLIKNKKVFYTILSITILIIVLIVRDMTRPIYPYSGFNFSKNEYFMHGYTEIAYKLNEIASPGNTVLTNDIGTVPYFSPQLKFVDLHGLTDKYIAKEVKGRHFFRSDPDYFLKLNCDYFVIIGAEKEIKNYKLSDTLAAFNCTPIEDFIHHKEFSHKYKPVCYLKGGIIFKNINKVN